MHSIISQIYEYQPFRLGDYVYALKWSVHQGYSLSKHKRKINKISLTFSEYNVKYNNFYDVFIYCVGKNNQMFNKNELFFNRDIGLKMVELLNKHITDDVCSEEYVEEILKLRKEDSRF